MTKIKYVGPKPEISQHGISYETGKEDKYVYLMVALDILGAIDHDYEDKKSYTSLHHLKTLNEKTLHNKLLQYEEELDQHIAKEIARYRLKIQHEIEEVNNMLYINKIEKETWIKNINLMSEYRIQRAINKIYYMHCINDIKNIIKREKIKEIDAPFNERFWHVLETIEGALETGKNSVATKLQEETNSYGDMIIKLYILF